MRNLRYDLDDLDTLRLVSGRHVSAQAFAAAVLKVAPREPQTSWLVYDGEGHPVAHGNEKMVERYGATHRIEEKKPTARALAKYRREKAAWDRLVALYEAFDAEGVRGYSPTGLLSSGTRNGALLRAIAQAIGAELWRPLPRGSEVAYTPGLGGRGIELRGPRGRVFLDLGIEGDNVARVYLGQVAVERKGEGLGTLVMEAIREHAAEKGYGVTVYKVANRAFFRKLDWLTERDGGLTFRADAEDLVPGPRLGM